MNARHKLTLATATLVLVAGTAGMPAQAQPALHRYADADLAVGEKLLAEHKCDACHSRRVGGDGTAIYRPKGRINTPAALLGMVEYCSHELKLSLFAEEMSAIAAVLQRDHYRFPAQAPR